jgi:hypothetical protein
VIFLDPVLRSRCGRECPRHERITQSEEQEDEDDEDLAVVACAGPKTSFLAVVACGRLPRATRPGPVRTEQMGDRLDRGHG